MVSQTRLVNLPLPSWASVAHPVCQPSLAACPTSVHLHYIQPPAFVWVIYPVPRWNLKGVTYPRLSDQRSFFCSFTDRVHYKKKTQLLKLRTAGYLVSSPNRDITTQLLKGGRRDRKIVRARGPKHLPWDRVFHIWQECHTQKLQWSGCFNKTLTVTIPVGMPMAPGKTAQPSH